MRWLSEVLDRFGYVERGLSATRNRSSERPRNRLLYRRSQRLEQLEERTLLSIGGALHQQETFADQLNETPLFHESQTSTTFLQSAATSGLDASGDRESAWRELAPLVRSDAYVVDADAVSLTSYDQVDDLAPDMAGTTLFSALTSPDYGIPSKTGLLGWDDFDTTLGAGTYLDVDQISIVASFEVIDEEVDFVFYEYDGAYIGYRSFLPHAPVYGQWNINISTPIRVPDKAEMWVFTNGNTAGVWRCGTPAPTVGSETRSFGYWASS